MTEQATRAVELAVAAAGQMDRGWRKRVYESIAEVSVMLREGSDAVDWAERIQASTVFKATFTGFEEEIPEGMDRPSRLIVHTQSDKAINTKPGPRQNLTGEEHVRTDPLWTKPGRLVADRIRQLPVGSFILIYKLTEDVDGDRKSRVITHFEVLRTPSTGGQERQEAAAPSEAPDQAPAVPPPSPPEPNSPQDNAAITKIESLFEQLSSRQRVAYGHLCRENGITNPMLPDPHRMEEAIQFLVDLGGEHG